MKIIRDSQALIGMLEGGELNQEMSTKLTETLGELGAMSEDNPKVVHKGNLTLKLDFAVANGMVTINADITTKTPKRARKSSVYGSPRAARFRPSIPSSTTCFQARATSANARAPDPLSSSKRKEK